MAGAGRGGVVPGIGSLELLVNFAPLALIAQAVPGAVGEELNVATQTDTQAGIQDIFPAPFTQRAWPVSAPVVQLSTLV